MGLIAKLLGYRTIECRIDEDPIARVHEEARQIRLPWYHITAVRRQEGRTAELVTLAYNTDVFSGALTFNRQKAIYVRPSSPLHS